MGAGVETRISASSEKSVSTGGAGAQTATIAAAVDTKTYVVMAIISADGTAAAGRVTLNYTKDGVAQVIGIRFAAANFAPVVVNFGSHPVEGDPNTAITLVVPAIGTNTEATLVYYQRPA